MSLSAQESQNRLQPYIDAYVNAINSGDVGKLKNFYHSNSVMVEKDKSCAFGQSDIVKSLEQMITECGRTTIQLTNSKYEGVGDFINIHTEFAFFTEKSGCLRGNFLQIWKLEDGKYSIYHDEFVMV